MRSPLPLSRLAAVALLVFTAGVATDLRAQNNPLIKLDENGVGSLDFPGNPAPFPTVGTLQPDPGPGGLSLALTYSLLGPPSLVAGDLLLLDPITLAISDIIRFNPAGTGSAGYPASVVFYSLSPGADLADTGFPTMLYANNLSLAENPTGPTSYTPTATEPGFVAGFSVTYSFNSPTAVPEPATLSMLGAGAALLLSVTRRRRKD